MRRLLLCAAVVLAGPTAASAQKPASPPAAKRCATWDVKSMVGPKDSVVVMYTLSITPDGKYSIKFPNRDPIATRVLASGGDSLAAEAGPYPSVLRAGQMVTTRTTAHFKGDAMTGTFEARYASGDVLKGKLAGTCRK